MAELRRRIGHYELSPLLSSELRNAFRLRVLPQAFCRRVEFHVFVYNVGERNRTERDRGRDSLRTIVTLAGKLKAALERGGLINDLFPAERLASQIDAMFDNIADMGPMAGRRQRRRLLRIKTLRTIEEVLNVRVTKNATGAAARAIGAVLNEADRLDGKEPKLRFNISGSDWARWVDDYREFRARTARKRSNRESSPVTQVVS